MEKPSGDENTLENNDEIIIKASRNEDIFDIIVGHIEEIIIGPEFTEIRENFLDSYYSKFEDCEENKHEYMDIYTKYTELIEQYIEKALVKKVPEFSMENFLNQVMNRHSQNDLEGEIFDMLVGLTDFLTFKDMILDHKAAKEGRMPDLFLGNVNAS